MWENKKFGKKDKLKYEKNQQLYWQLKGKAEFESLAMVFRQLGVVPAGQVETERFFSLAGFVQGGRRWRLHAKNLRATTLQHLDSKEVKKAEKPELS